MAIPRFIKTPNPKRFNYTPLYWDPDKEEREQRVRNIKAEMGIDVDLRKKSSTITRGSFRNTPPKSNAKASKNANKRLILIIVVLLLISYLIFYR